MSVNHELLREGIIQKLKDINAYIDNELPDYIMVMLANKKTVHQINNDLQLFLGDNTNLFTSWLQNAISDPSTLSASHSERDRTPGLEEDSSPKPVSGEEEGEDRTPPPPPKAVAGTKRKRSEGGSHPKDHAHHRTSVEREGEEPSPPKVSKVAKAGSGEESSRVPRVKVHLGDQDINEGERSRRSVRRPVVMKPQSSRDTDLRELIAERRASHRHQRGGGGDSGEEEGEGRSATVTSVVRIVERPQLSSAGGSRLLQRAIRGLGGRGQLPRGGARQQEGAARQPGSSSKSAGPRARKQPKLTSTTSATEEVPSSTSSLPTPPHLPTPSDQDSDLPDDKVEESFVDEFREEQQEEEERRELMEQATIAAVKKVLPREGVGQRVGQEVGKGVGPTVKKPDLRELLNKSKGKSNSHTRFVVTLDGLGDRYQYVDTSEDLETEGGGEAEGEDRAREEEEQEVVEEEEEEEQEEDTSDRGGGMPERCRFWPNCKNGDSCPFHHPSAACRLFPNCKYGNKCLFIHPQCKFDSRCTRADCPYMHTAPRHLAFKPPIPVAPPAVFQPQFKPNKYSYNPRTGGGGGGGGASPWTRPSRFPNKSALTWTPSKSQHISDRQFAAPEDQTAAFPI